MFGYANFATLFAPLIVAWLIDFLSFIIGKCYKTSKSTRERFRVYLALTPGVNFFVILWYGWKILMTKVIRARIVQDYSNIVTIENDNKDFTDCTNDIENIALSTTSEEDDKREFKPKSTSETRDAISNLAIKYKRNHEEYSTYSREYFYSHCLHGLAGNVPQIVLQLAFLFRRGFCSDNTVIVVLANLISFTLSSTNAFYYLPRKYFETIPWNLELKHSFKLYPMFCFANLARLYVLVFLVAYIFNLISSIYFVRCHNSSTY